MAAFATISSRLLRNALSRPPLASHQHTSPSPPLLLLQTTRLMSSQIFVGGLSWGTDDDALEAAFASFGEVTNAKVIIDRETGRSRGFGFVSFTSSSDAEAAIQSMDGRYLGGRAIRVSHATGRPPMGRGGFGGSYGGGSLGFGGSFGGDGSSGFAGSYGRDRPSGFGKSHGGNFESDGTSYHGKSSEFGGSTYGGDSSSYGGNESHGSFAGSQRSDGDGLE